MTNIFWIAFGGAIGAVLRYFTLNFIKFINLGFPLGTFAANLLGSFIIGLVINSLENKIISENFIKYFFIIGVLGSYTTFSTFSFEVIDLYNNKKFIMSFIYIILTLFSCLIGTYIGYNLNK